MYKIYGIYNGKKEEIDHANTIEKAEYLVNEYRLAFGNGWFIYYK